MATAIERAQQELGYSRDQFYRRVRALTSDGLLHPSRGSHNELILSPEDWAVIERLAALEAERPDLGYRGTLALFGATLLHERETARIVDRERRAMAVIAERGRRRQDPAGGFSLWSVLRRVGRFLRIRRRRGRRGDDNR